MKPKSPRPKKAVLTKLSELDPPISPSLITGGADDPPKVCGPDGCSVIDQP